MCPSEADRRQAGQRSMRAVVVVAVPPVLGHAADLVQAREHVAIEYLGAESTVEALDVCILGRLAGLDVEQLDAVPLRPGLERGTDELWAVVEPKPPRCAPHLDQFIECPNDASGREAGVDLDALDSRLKSS